MSEFTSYLFARPSFLEGFARVADFAGSLNTYNVSGSSLEADDIALKNDWRAIGQDLSAAIRSYDRDRGAIRSYAKKQAT